ncbi:MAG: DUF547 domain-containing protein [Betaproteobacteria bacterium]|nr:DUF547 domain-containing protein [Betaproteobacteria bacterium]
MIPAIAAVVAGMLMFSPLAQAQQDDPYRAWGRVLARFVGERGEVDFRALSRDRGELDAFLDHVARISPRSAPESFPGREAKLAYYINAYNALAMFNVIDSDFPRRLDGWRKIRFFVLKRFPVGGEWMSLYALENDFIRPLGDERAHFALNCMVLSCPRLPRAAFTPEELNRQLDKEARQFFAETRNLQILPALKLARVSGILEFYSEDFLARATTLIAYINQHAPERIPENFAIEFLDYDWTVNDRRRGVEGHESE